MNFRYLDNKVMNITEIIWNNNDLISSIDEPIQIPFLTTKKTFDKVKRIILNQVDEIKFDKKKNYIEITREGNPIIEFAYNDEQLAKASSNSWECKYDYKSNIVKIVISSGKEPEIPPFGKLLFTLNSDGQVIKKEIYTKWIDGKLQLNGKYYYRYVAGRLVEKEEFGPENYEEINFDPIYDGQYKLNFITTYEYFKCKDDAWKICQFVDDKEEDEKTKFREYLFNKFGDLEYLLSFGLDQEITYEVRNHYKYDLYRNWVYKKESIINRQISNQSKVNEIERVVEYF